ncbi:hypothetical protein LWI29_007311 [Acer saccharum]|uniref:Uncharacterized protein n=1 Tax=Acer saccharum TaxID=4024 RepID=A0AA39RR55_ACESA|nr:hypothetical protein LWI29_007311 [Acer saccharum]KAK1557253.1 hypothetical protein Q3G72_021060 [Acer saccharum]
MLYLMAVEPADSSSKAEDIEMAIVPFNMVYADEPISICQPIAIRVETQGASKINFRFMMDSPIMRFVQAVDVFQSMPQEPHFRPLAEYEEFLQEGIALRLMMNFVNVATIQASDPIINFDSLLKCLSELELHGFNVEAVQSRILELQSMKDSQEKLYRSRLS